MTGQIGSYQGPGEAPGSDSDYAFDGWVPSNVRGKLTRDAPLDKLVWFKSGGKADWLFEPADLDDLAAFLGNVDEGTPVRDTKQLQGCFTCHKAIESRDYVFTRYAR